MKLNSISGITCLVKDIQKTAAFYEALGFRIGKQDEQRLTCYVNWFWIDFVAAGQGNFYTSRLKTPMNFTPGWFPKA